METIITKIKTLVESVTGLPFIYESRGGLNLLLDNADYPCAYMTLLKTSSVTNDNGMIVESAQVAIVICDKTEYDLDSIANEAIIAQCKVVANNIIKAVDTTGELRLVSVNGGERFYNEFDIILTGYAINVTFEELIGDTGCDVPPTEVTFVENGEYDVKGVQVAKVEVGKIPEKEILLNYFRNGGVYLGWYKATERFDLDLSSFKIVGTQNIILSDTTTNYIHIKGDLTLPAGGNYGSNTNSLLLNAIVEGTITLMPGATMPVIYSTLRGCTHFVANGCNGGGLGTINFVSSGAFYLEARDFTYNALSWETKPASFLLYNNTRKSDLRGLVILPLDIGQFNVRGTCSTTLIGDAEEEEYDVNTKMLLGYKGSVNLRNITQSYKSVMACANGVGVLDFAGAKFFAVTISMRDILRNANLLEEFESVLTEKNFNIVYQ